MHQAPESSTIGDALRAASKRLAAASETPRLDAEVLLRHVLGYDRTTLFLHLQSPLTIAAERGLTTLLERRLAGEPVAYLTGQREFMGWPFGVAPGVLIPRPETEILVEWARARSPLTTVVDIGTGSGAIALSLAAHSAPGWAGQIVASDVSAAALTIASENRRRLGLNDRVAFVRGDLATWCQGPVDLLLANLPYLRPDQIGTNPALRAEPRLALLGGDDGLDLVRRLIADLPRLLAAAAAVGFEIDPSQAATVASLLQTTLPGSEVTILPDLAGLPRHVIARIGAVAP